MVHADAFSKADGRGLSWGGNRVPPAVVRITAGAEVALEYEGKRTWVLVSEVIAEGELFDGVVTDFGHLDLSHGDLKHGDRVRFRYEHIHHVSRWIEGDQPGATG